MRKIIYYVATSLDGFIAGKNGDVSMFATQGEGVEQYAYDLESFDTVIMGRNTYEFGYQYGMRPGDPAYPNMEHFIFSNSMQLQNASNQVKVLPLDVERLNRIRKEVGSDIYCCGGGMFAGWLLKQGMIDELRLKVNPIMLGDGVRLFGDYATNPSRLNLVHNQTYEDGFQIVSYQMLNS